jgi:anti-sigma factor RsiW
MKESERQELLLLALSDELSAVQKTRFEELLAADAGLRTEWEQMRQVQDLVSTSRAERFDPHFSTRVMARIRRERREEVSLADGLLRAFRPLVPATLAVALLLAVLNWQDRDLLADEEASFLEITFAMPTVSVETAEIMEL